MDTIETISYQGYTINISYDELPMHPREEWDNLGTMICYHRRYSLGDKEANGEWNPHDYDSWKEFREAVQKHTKGGIVLPLALYDHSGLHIYVGTRAYEFDPGGWDSMPLGFIFATRQKILECYGKKRLTGKIREQAEKVLRSEIESYNHFLNGQIYAADIEKDGKNIETWGGYFSTKDAIEEAKTIIDSYEQADKNTNDAEADKRANQEPEVHCTH